jgi:N-acyl amino acid synthase of PEP-CTERM/exosortase system
VSEIFRPMTLDDCPALLEESYRLRYQVYCLERNFLHAEDYPDQREVDEFDRDSVHVGVVEDSGDLVGTARLVKPSGAGLPLLRHCTLYPDVTTLDDCSHTVVEVSRVSISRHYRRRRGDPPFSAAVIADDEALALAVRRKTPQKLAEPVR